MTQHGSWPCQEGQIYKQLELFSHVKYTCEQVGWICNGVRPCGPWFIHCTNIMKLTITGHPGFSEAPWLSALCALSHTLRLNVSTPGDLRSLVFETFWIDHLEFLCLLPQSLALGLGVCATMPCLWGAGDGTQGSERTLGKCSSSWVTFLCFPQLSPDPSTSRA